MRSRIQWKRISTVLDLVSFTISLAMPTAHELSHRMIVGGWW
jgi:hypothetical protein